MGWFPGKEALSQMASSVRDTELSPPVSHLRTFVVLDLLKTLQKTSVIT